MRKALKSEILLSLLIPFFFLSYIPASQAQESITISGNIKNIPHGGHPHTTVTATYSGSQEVLATTHTEEDGNFTLVISPTFVPGINLPENAVAPNPFFNSTRVFFTSRHSAPHSFILTSTTGRVLYNSTRQLHSGETLEINIEGLGPAGIYLLQVTSPKGIDNYKLVQLNENNQRDINIQHSIQAQIKNDKNNTMLLQFESQNHMQKDTTLTWQSHSNVNVNLAQIPQFRDININYFIKNNPMNQAVQNAQLSSTNNLGQHLFNGETNIDGLFNTTLSQEFYPWQGDTIFIGHEIITNITAENHHQKTIYDQYKENITREIILEQISHQKTAELNMNFTSIPLMHGPTLDAYILNQQDTIAETTITNGQQTLNFEYQEYINGEDTLRLLNNAPITNITILAGNNNHEEQNHTLPFQEQMNLYAEIEQTPEQKIAELNMNFTSTPLMYAPTLDAIILNQEDTITTTTITNGQQTLNFEYQEYTNNQDTLRLLNNAPITNITILASNNNHEEQNHTLPFQEQMNLYAEIEQTPEQGETTITTNLTGNIFGEAPNAVNLTYKNNETNELLTQGESVNGEHTAQIPFLYWEHDDLYHTTLNEIKQEITKPGTYESQTHTLENNNQTTNYTLTQIPEQKTATIIGTVKNTAQIPVQGADVEILNEETQYATTTTLESGEFETTMPYTKYTNPENQEQTQTIPENIHAKITKPQYETTTTQPQNLEDLINFGEITLTPEPVIKNLNFTFKPLTIMGDPQHPDNVIFVRLGDVVQSYVVGTQEEINVNITAETTDNHVTIWDTPPVNANDEPWYNETIIIHEQNRDWHKQPIANNDLTANRTTANQAYDTLQLNINLIHNRDDLELLKMYNSFDHPDQGTIYTNKYRFAKFITGRSGWQIRSHQPTPEGDGWQIFMLTYNQANPDEEVSQQFIDNWTNSTTQVLNASIRNDGQKTFDWTPIHYVNTPTDPTYLAAEANNWINTLRIVPITGQGSATNSVSGGYTHHVWGRVRTPPGDTAVEVGLEETKQATYRLDDPEFSTLAYILEYVDGQPQLNLFAKRVAQFRNQLQHGTTYISPPSTND